MASILYNPMNKEPPDPPSRMSYANAAKDNTKLLKNYASLIEKARNE